MFNDLGWFSGNNSFCDSHLLYVLFCIVHLQRYVLYFFRYFVFVFYFIWFVIYDSMYGVSEWVVFLCWGEDWGVVFVVVLLDVGGYSVFWVLVLYCPLCIQI